MLRDSAIPVTTSYWQVWCDGRHGNLGDAAVSVGAVDDLQLGPSMPSGSVSLMDFVLKARVSSPIGKIVNAQQAEWRVYILRSMASLAGICSSQQDGLRCYMR